MRNITIYSSDDCGACQQIVPLISNLAKKKGISVKVIDVEECGKPCDSINYVPLIKVDGRQVENVESFLRNLMG